MKAYVFPGQGAQFTGMGKDLYETSAIAKELFDKANEILGFNITEIMFNGTDEELKQTYLIYQEILHALKTNSYKLLKSILSNPNNHISSYMKTAVKTLIEFLPYIKNTFTTKYLNGYIEGNNNFIKVIKRIAFGFRSFRRFKARIMICKGLIKIKKIANA